MMPRILGKGVATYLVTNKCHNTKPLLASAEIKERFRELLWKAAEFSCVEVRSYTIMDDSIEFIVTVPERKEVTKDAILKKIGILYGELKQGIVELHWKLLARDAENTSIPKSIRDEKRKRLNDEVQGYLTRMFNLGQFVKVLKECFDVEYKNLINATGTLWNGRYRSELLAENGAVPFDDMATVEMLAVREGKAISPEAYKWCSLGRMRSEKEEHDAIVKLLRDFLGGEISDAEALAQYKVHVYHHGLEARDPKGKVIVRGVTMQMCSDAEAALRRCRLPLRR